MSSWLGQELGEWSAWILGGMLLITLWQRFPYHLWRYVHKALALVYLVLAFHSVVLAPASYWSQPAGWLVAACALLGSACALLSLSGRIGRARRHAGVVTAVERHGESLLEVTCRLQGDWSHRAGQFAFHLRPPGGCPSVHHRQRRPRLRRGALQH